VAAGAGAVVASAVPEAGLAALLAADAVLLPAAAGSGLASRLRASTFELVTGLAAGKALPLVAAAAGAAATAAASTEGETTRSTCPTSIRLGLSRWFQAARSRQFCPVSSATRISVSPGLTV